jgi:CheY-like chemotaxis protein
MPSDAAPAGVSNAPDEPGLVVVRVLIAEDEAMIALSLADLLEDEGYAVTIAGDGVAALAQARRMGNTLDLLITDLNMPEMSGEDLIQALQIEQPDVPVVVITGSAPFGGLEELRRQGGGHTPFALLHKPLDYPALLDTLRCAVADRRMSPGLSH